MKLTVDDSGYAWTGVAGPSDAWLQEHPDTDSHNTWTTTRGSAQPVVTVVLGTRLGAPLGTDRRVGRDGLDATQPRSG